MSVNPDPSYSTLVVIPCLNEAAHIEHLLERLRADEGCRDALIVVADGGSADGSRDIVARVAATDERIKLLDNPRRLQSAGVNSAVERFRSNAAFLVRIDAHAEYPQNFVAGLLHAAETTGAASVVVPMKSIGVGCFQKAAAIAQNSVLGTGGAAHRVAGQAGGRWVDHGHHALFRMETFVALGGYDAAMSHNEDAEYDGRLRKSDGAIWLEPSLEIGYYPRSNAKALFKQYFNYGRGRAKTLSRGHAKIKLRQMVPVPIAPVVVLGIAGAAFQPLLIIPALFWLGACLGGGVAVGGRKGRCGWLSGVPAAISHFAWSAGFCFAFATMWARGGQQRPVTA